MSQQRTEVTRKILNLSVNRSLQLRMIAKISAILLVCLLISSGVFYQFANQQISGSFQLYHIQARKFLDFLWPVVGIAFVISLAAGTLASLFVPKNVAGPLHRMEQDVRRIAEGDLTVQIKLRAGDEGGPLAAEINRLVGRFRVTISGIQDGLRQAKAIPDPGSEHMQKNCQAIYDRMAKLLNKFTIDEKGPEA